MTDDNRTQMRKRTIDSLWRAALGMGRKAERGVRKDRATRRARSRARRFAKDLRELKSLLLAVGGRLPEPAQSPEGPRYPNPARRRRAPG
jgi:hypothetical protein